MVKINLDKKIFKDLEYDGFNFTYKDYILPTIYHDLTKTDYFLIELFYSNYDDYSKDILLELRSKIITFVRNKFSEQNLPSICSWDVSKVYTPSLYSQRGHTSEYLKYCNCGNFYYCQSKLSITCQTCLIKPHISSEIKKEYNRKYQLKKKISLSEKECLICNQKFIPKRITKKTCSDKCRKMLERLNKN